MMWLKICTDKVLKTLVYGFIATVSFTSAALDGEALYKQKFCASCHGEEGKAPIMPSYPTLDGQKKAYLIAQIKDIKSGKRNNGASAAMKGLVANLTDEEIEAISAYLESVK